MMDSCPSARARCPVDELGFRQLLAQRLGTLLERRVIAAGAACLARSRVANLRYESERDGGHLIGVIKGRGEPQAASLHLMVDADELRLESHCTCSRGGGCRHVAAIALHALRSPEAVADSLAPEVSSPDSWTRWLDEFCSAAPAQTQARPAGGAAPLRAGILLRLDDTPLPSLLAQARRLKRGRDGRFSTPQPLEPAWDEPAPWRELDPASFQLIAGLRMRTACHDACGTWYRLASRADALLFEQILDALPCFFEAAGNGRLRAGPLRALRIGWEAREDGSQKLALSVDGAAWQTRLFQLGGLWYFDPEAREIGHVDGEARLVEAVLRAPSLLPEQIPRLRERWRDLPLLAKLPMPAAAEIERREVKPVPVLRLRALTASSAGAAPQAIGCLRLGFDYAGIRVPLAPAKPLERHRQAGRLVELLRDRASEMAACERLEELGLVPVELAERSAGWRLEGFDDSDFVLGRGRGQPAGVDQLFALTPRLRDLGFRLESGEGFPFDLMDEPQAWYAQIEEKAGKPWFGLRLGVELGGERVDLLPALRRLLEDPLFPLEPRRGEAPDAVWLVPIDARRRVPLPLARLRELIEPLLEWLPAVSASARSLRLRRGQGDVIARLEQDASLEWRGGERLRAQLAELRAPRRSAEPPPGFRGALRGYQRDGLAWLGFLAEAGLGGILADDMGLGKTVQVLAHLLAEKARGRLERPALVIAPTSLVGNWRDEAQRFAPELAVLVIHGPDRAGLHTRIPEHDLVITTYPLLLRDRAALIAHQYSVLVLDETQVIKNARAKAARAVREIAARQRLAMTGTPLENHLGELWAQFDAVEPGLLGGEKHFTRFFRTPIEKHGDAERRERLQRRIAPLMLRRRKEDVLAELPSKTEILRAIDLEGDQLALYEILRLGQRERVLAEVRKCGLAQSGIAVLDALLKLRQVCCDPRLVKLEEARTVAGSAKLEYLLELVASLVDEGRRVLVFSQFAEMLALIAAAFAARGISCQSLTGRTPGTERAGLIERFQQGAVPVFLISLKAGGVGLNLTAADAVVHYDPWWNPAAEAQATDRSHRIGQDKPVFVYKLICRGTVEERIRALQQRKAELAAAVLEGGSTQELRFDEADLAELFAPA